MENIDLKVGSENQEKKYSQEQMDDIASKVKENAVKLFLKENFEVEDANEFKSRIDNEKAQFLNLEGKVKEVETKLIETETKYKTDMVKNLFINKFGGREDALQSLIDSNQELLQKEVFEEELSRIKKTSPFFFHEDKTIINLNDKVVKKTYYDKPIGELFDGTNKKIKV